MLGQLVDTNYLLDFDIFHVSQVTELLHYVDGKYLTCELGGSNTGHVDTWTRRETGCACPDTGGLACPCCNQGGCPCPRHGRCVQCGLEAACAGGQYDHLNTSDVLRDRAGLPALFELVLW